MNVKVKKSGTACKVCIDGEMTIYTVTELKNRLIRSLSHGEATEIDLGGVTEMDTAGLQLLLLARRESEKLGKSLRLTQQSPAVLDIFEGYRMEAYFGAPPATGGDRP